MKRADLVTSSILIPVDYVMLLTAGMCSYALRFQSVITRFRPVLFEYSFNDFFSALTVISLFGIGVFAISGSYTIANRHHIFDIFPKVFLGVSTTILFVIVAIFLQRELFSSRFIIIFAWIISIVFVCVGRIVVYWLEALFLKQGYGIHKVAILGDGKIEKDIEYYFEQHKHYGNRIVQRFVQFNEQTKNVLIELRKQNAIDELLVTYDSIGRSELMDMIQFCHEYNIIFRYVASMYQTKLSTMDVDTIAGYPVVQISKTPLEGWGKIIKRVVDILVSIVALIVIAPFGAIIAVCIKIDSKGPSIVGLKRIGKGKKIFTLYKFRSMVDNAHALKKSMMDLNERNDGPLFKITNDPRITKIGVFLRRSSLDELPQFWNVLKGDMSLVGPRPHEPEEVTNYKPEHKSLVAIKPGMTGLSQVSGRSNLLFDEEASLDMFYIENWSLGLDIQILFKTLFVVIKARNAA